MKQTPFLAFLVLQLCIAYSTFAQPKNYSPANAHSHNDYEQTAPFHAAYEAGFGSIEADIFLQNDSLQVAHHARDIRSERTLENLYLKPLAAVIEKNQGHVYADSTRSLQLMIDIKTAALPTLARLVQVLQQYPTLIKSNSLKIVISGNRPEPSAFTSYPSWIWFDGEMSKAYSKQAFSRIVMMSDNLKTYTSWNGEGPIPNEDRTKLQKLITLIHTDNKKIRFWNAPDAVNAWNQLMKLQVDYINTDHIPALAAHLSRMP